MSVIKKHNLIKEAIAFLRSRKTKDDFVNIKSTLGLAKSLSKLDFYYYSREILSHLRIEFDYNLKLEDRHNLAKYIYKDATLSSDFKFNQALSYLSEHKEISTVQNLNTARLIGSIYKKWYSYDKNDKNLSRAKHFYEKGYLLWKTQWTIKDGKMIENEVNDIEDDYGFCALNYAYILEKEALINLKEYNSYGCNEQHVDVEDQLSLVKKVRENILEWITIIKNNTEKIKNQNIKESSNEVDEKGQNIKNKTNLNQLFLISNQLECLIGLCKYEKAKLILEDFNKLKVVDKWKLKSTNIQLIGLYKTHIKLISLHPSFKEGGFDGEIFRKLLTIIFPEINQSYFLNQNKKVGLALSGGGFRASYFHIGVMAALAEKNELKDVDVLSCVSGGSILGAFYYLKVKKILESKKDDVINKEDYICIVRNMIDEFHENVQENMRLRWFTNLFCNLKMVFSENYSRTHRMAELYDYFFYQPLTGKKTIALNKTIIDPEGVKPFKIKEDNFYRINKVPQIVINTTALNTGHNFQFGATWMGESPILINKDIDSKPILRRMYYKNAPKAYQSFPLCNAVGASACVPALFGAMPLDDLYENIDLKIVDGGVNDNQGLDALMENECKNIIISDASGQLQYTNEIKSSTLNEMSRAYNVSLEKNRDFLINSLINDENKYDSLLLLHLKKGLSSKSVNWIGNKQPVSKTFANNNEGKTTNYNVDVSIQNALAEIRTDLDSFSDTEAYSLMYSGYLQTIKALFNKEKNKENKDLNASKEICWKFKTKMEEPFENDSNNLAEELKIGKKKFFKWFYLMKLKQTNLFLIIATSIISFLFLWIGYLVYPFFTYSEIDICLKDGLRKLYDFLNKPLCTSVVKWLILLFLMDVLILFFTKKKFSHFGIIKTPFYIFLAIGSWLVSNLLLLLSNNLFLRLGKVFKR